MANVMRKPHAGATEFAYILAPGESPKPGTACFAPAELNWAERLASSMSDLDQRRDFWAGIFENKRRDPNFSVYTAFPVAEEPSPLAPPQERVKRVELPGAPLEVRQRYLKAILSDIRERNARKTAI